MYSGMKQIIFLFTILFSNLDTIDLNLSLRHKWVLKYTKNLEIQVESTL